MHHEEMFSFVYGADEFIYVLGKCLINYGSVIGQGMYQSATERKPKHIVGRATVFGPVNKKEVELGRPKNFSPDTAEEIVITAPQKHRPVEPSPSQPIDAPIVSSGSKRAKLDWSKWTSAPSWRQTERDQQEDDLREHIRDLRVDIEEDDDSILEMADIAGLEPVKAALDEFAVRHLL